MSASGYLLACCCLAVAPAAGAYQYPLQFTPHAGATGLVVAGYAIHRGTVVGDCSYHIVHVGSGRGGRGSTTYYPQTCSWDLRGKLLGVAPGAPAVPAPLYTRGTQTVYALAANGAFTGSDTKLAYRGFVDTPDSHYSWLSSNANAPIQPAPYTFTATLTSDGDVPLHVSSVTVSAVHAPAVVNGTTCNGQIAVGSSCSITVTYDPSGLCSPPSGLVHDRLVVSVTSDAGQANDMIQSYTISTSLNGTCEDD